MPYTIEDLVLILEELQKKVHKLQLEVNYMKYKNLNRTQSPPFMAIGDGACLDL